ncbi:hypothetical protein, partial [Nocardiopsis exhalans]|uniref:hypothetical protein n=1 Tax=Nocardiopsis exhalans TaxID=163604 RepID=UPI0031D671E6
MAHTLETTLNAFWNSADLGSAVVRTCSAAVTASNSNANGDCSGVLKKTQAVSGIQHSPWAR